MKKLNFLTSSEINPFVDFPLSKLTKCDLEYIEMFMKKTHMKLSMYMVENIHGISIMYRNWYKAMFIPPNQNKATFFTYQDMMEFENTNQSVNQFFCETIRGFNELSPHD